MAKESREFRIITPEQHVAETVGALLADHLSFLAEQRKQLAAFRDKYGIKENLPEDSPQRSDIPQARK